jgi:hypothetical protein
MSSIEKGIGASLLLVDAVGDADEIFQRVDVLFALSSRSFFGGGESAF